MLIAITVFLTVLLVCATVLIYQHRAFSSTRFAELKEQLAATQKVVAQLNAWQIKIADHLRIELVPEKKK